MLFVAMLVARVAMAGYPHLESGDAGDLSDPQNTFDYDQIGTSLALDTITGRLGPSEYVDAFCIQIDDPGLFKATTSSTDDPRASASFDTRLFLFAYGSAEDSRDPMLANDDSPGGGFQSLLTDPSSFPGTLINSPVSLVAGRYVLAINGYPDEVLDQFGNPIFDFSPNANALVGPSGMAAVSWDTGGSNQGIYTIALTGTSGCGPNLAFIPTQTGSGKLSTWALAGGNGGVAAGDAVCQSVAENELGLSGTFRALLSDASNDAFCHVLETSGKRSNLCDSGGTLKDDEASWVRLGGRPFIRNFRAALNTEEVFFPMMRDVAGTLVQSIWTGSYSDAVWDPTWNCSDWTQTGGVGSVGSVPSGGDRWISDGGVACSDTSHLLCLQTGFGPRAPAPNPGDTRQAFVTSVSGGGDLGSWPQAQGQTGLAAADAICQTLAGDNSLDHASSYVAFLSTSTVDAKDRLPNDPFGWSRLDGTLLGSRAKLTGPGSILSNLALTESGSYLTAVSVHTGTGSDGTVSGTDTCSDWTSTSGSSAYGYCQSADDRWKIYPFSGSCGDQRPLYCFATNSVGLFYDGFESGDTQAWF